MSSKLRIAIPKGRMFDSVIKLLGDSEIYIKSNNRSYRPYCSDPDVEIKILKPQNIPKLIELGAHDIGFTGYDWIRETNSDVEELLDTGLEPVKIVAAVSRPLMERYSKKEGKWIVASEYETITRNFLDKKGIDYTFVRSYGSTEVFPPDDADMIIDNCSTGMTLKENGLEIVDEIIKSSTRVIMNSELLKDKNNRKNRKAMDLITLFESVLMARKRVLIELNADEKYLDAIVKEIPAMKSPTIQQLYKGIGYAVKAAVLRSELPRLIPRLKQLGATDIVQTELKKVLL